MASPFNDLMILPDGNGFAVVRGGKPLETPKGLPFIVPARALAEAIGQEFAAQGLKTDVRKMPMTQYALTAIDVSGPQKDDIVSSLARMGGNELLCQRASEPPELVAEEARVWQPYLDWCKERFGAEFCLGSGIVPVDQRPETLSVLRAHIEALDAFALTGLSEACNVSGSLVLGLVLLEGRADADAVFEAAELDQLWQSCKWGSDPITEGRLNAVRQDIAACARWLSLIGAA
ncbi:MAG: ATPase [Alphaproteobacteria bacterium]|nr:ATPase [Alphaproteobacteria bacterium]